MKDRHQAPAYPLRLPEDLKNQVVKAAEEMGRSLNAEIIARLQASFSPWVMPPYAVTEPVADLVTATGCTREEALTRLVLAGQSKAGIVLNVRIAPDTTVAQVKGMLEEAYKHVPPDADFIVEREGRMPPKP